MRHTRMVLSSEAEYAFPTASSIASAWMNAVCRPVSMRSSGVVGSGSARTATAANAESVARQRQGDAHPHIPTWNPEEEARVAIALGGDVVIERNGVFDLALPARCAVMRRPEAGGAGVFAARFR